MKKVIRDDDCIVTDEKKDMLKGEIGDVLWYVAQFCTEIGLDLEEVAQSNLDKLNSRKERGTLEGDGDCR